MSGSDLERFRGILGAEFHEKRRQMIEEVLAASEISPTGPNPTTDGDVMQQRMQTTLKECLADLQHLTELGQIVSALVHEASQPLSAIGNYTAACHHLVATGDTEQLKWALTQITEQTERAWRTVQRIREFVK